MENRGEMPDFEIHSCLSKGQVVSLEEDIIWPSLNHIWGEDFFENAVPNEKILKRAKIPSGTEAWCDIEMAYEQYPPDEDGDEEVVIFAQIVVSIKSDEIFDSLVQAFKSNHAVGLEDKDRKLSEKLKKRFKKGFEKEIKDKNLTAWEVITYTTYHANPAGLKASKRFELRDHFECEWSSDNGFESELVDDIEIQALNDEFETLITLEDCFLLKEALKSLHVPEEILQKPI